MNKAELIAALADRLDGDHRGATLAVENTIDILVRSVAEGESITIMGFGIFERRDRAARVARNPRTGESIAVPATQVPAFRPSQYFKDIVQGRVALSADGLAVKRVSSHEGFQTAERPAAASEAGISGTSKEASKNDKASKTSKSGKSEKSAKASKAEKTGTSSKGSKASKSGKSVKSKKSDKSDKSKNKKSGKKKSKK